MKKERTVEALCNAKELILLPEIIPVLRGSCHLHGLIYETDHETEKFMVPSKAVERPGKRSMNKKVRIEPQSGTCNVCSAPCSSCMHRSQVYMGSKGNGFSDESCCENDSSQYSINEGDVLTLFKSGACEDLQQGASEASNQVSVCSNHDSFAENAESKASMRSSNIFDASEDVEVLPKLRSGGTVAKNHFSQNPQCDSNQKASCIEDPKGVEGHDDNTSGVKRAKNSSIVDSCLNKNVDMKNVTCSPISVGSLDLKGCDKTAAVSLGAYMSKKVICGDSVMPCGYADSSIQKVLPSLSIDISSPKLVASEIPFQEDTDAEACLLKVQGLNSHCNNTSPCNSHFKGSEENSSLQPQEKLPELLIEHINSSSIRKTGSDSHVQKSVAHEDGKNSLIGGGLKVAVKVSPSSESETEKEIGDLGEAPLMCSDQTEHDNSNELVELPEGQESPVQSLSGDETGESDVVEQDVKVCDICGDAGREDLLAVCSRCSDGAEHTYCMREMLKKVPEGEWLCEECKFAEETENQKQGEPDVGMGYASSLLSGPKFTELAVKLDSRGSDLDAKGSSRVSSSPRISGKRTAENVEVASTLKRQALEASIRSPKSSSIRVSALSRGSSFKGLEKGKLRPAHQTSNGDHSNNDFAESARLPSSSSRLQLSKGTLLKSKSFSVISSKPKIKLVDDVPPKQKGARENTTLDKKDGVVRMMGKSMSFKTINSGRSNAIESKVKMLSPKVSFVQDFRGPKYPKDRSTFERKNLSKLERPLVSSSKISSVVSTPKGYHKLTSRGESSLSSISNSRDQKLVLSDGKLTSLSRSTSNLGRKGTETTCVSGGLSSAEQKSNQVSLKEEPSSSSSLTGERPSSNANGVLQDGFPQGEKTKESSISRPKQTVTTGLKMPAGQKCKEAGQDAESCTISSPRSSGFDVSTARSFREDMKEGSKLKAAITAAMLKKPGIYKKKVAPDKFEELSISNMDLNGEVASQNKLSVPSTLRNMISADGIHNGQPVLQSSTLDSYKLLIINNIKQPTTRQATNSFKEEDADSILACDGKSTIREVSSDDSAVMPVCKLTAIPEHEYIWQGNFEVYRGGKQPDLCGGIQAHVSTCASPKVLEVMNKFPRKLFLSEVPRLSTWPVQFHERGAKEENIALYFFAKDLESYHRSYKCLVESMMKNDLALKGNLDGVEILIFPSNQLPEKFQRWNMLFFLWGVFKGKKVNGSNYMSGSSNKLDIPSLNITPVDKDIPATLMSYENQSLPKCKNEDLSSCYKSFVVLASDPLAAGISNGYYDTKCEPVDQKCLRSLALSDQQHSTLESHSLHGVQTSNSVLCPGIRCTNTPVKEVNNLDCKQNVDVQPSVRSYGANSDSNEGEKTTMHWDASFEKQNLSTCSVKILPNGNPEVNGRCLDEKKRLDVINSSKVGVKLEVDLMEDVSVNEEASTGRDLNMKEPNNWQFSRKRPHIDLDEKKRSDIINSSKGAVKLEVDLMEDVSVNEEASMGRDLNMKEPNNWQFSRKRPHIDLVGKPSEPCIRTSQTVLWNNANNTSAEEEGLIKKLKSGITGAYGYDNCRDRTSKIDGCASEIRDLPACSSTKVKGYERPCDKKVILEDSGSAERFFFPVASHNAKNLQLGEKSMPWKAPEPEKIQFHDRIPNLELALGAETKSGSTGMLPFLVGMVDKQNNQGDPLDKVTVKEGEDVSASLSLSLSFPFPDKEETAKAAPKTEQLLPERHRVNTSLVLFGGFPEK